MNQNDKLDLILKQQDESKDDMTYVKSLLEDNNKTGQKGAMVRLRNIEVDVEELKGRGDSKQVKQNTKDIKSLKFINKIMAWGTTGGGAAIAAKLSKLF